MSQTAINWKGSVVRRWSDRCGADEISSDNAREFPQYGVSELDLKKKNRKFLPTPSFDPEWGGSHCRRDRTQLISLAHIAFLGAQVVRDEAVFDRQSDQRWIQSTLAGRPRTFRITGLS